MHRKRLGKCHALRCDSSFYNKTPFDKLFQIGCLVSRDGNKIGYALLKLVFVKLTSICSRFDNQYNSMNKKKKCE